MGSPTNLDLRILRGQLSGVVQGLRQCVTKLQLSDAQSKTLSGVANYLYRNRHRMRYDHYVAQGWPTASGPVEGACKNLIKDRMERSGMRWTEAMAEAIVKLRAIYLSGDFDAYWPFHIQKDPQRLHPPGTMDRRPKVATPNQKAKGKGQKCGRRSLPRTRPLRESKHF